jgi:hypothetical protein
MSAGTITPCERSLEMKRTIMISAFIIFALLIVFPRAAVSEVKITLKNGREIIADSCSEVAGKLTCYKSGGTFRIDRKEILNMKNISIERSLPVEETAPADVSSEQKKDEPKDAEAVRAEENKAGVKPPEGAPSGEQGKRLAEIRTKRASYEAEREILIKEREQLHEEVKAVGIIDTPGKYQYFQQKIYDLDVRIKSFNEKVNKLNEEISVLENAPQKKAP